MPDVERKKPPIWVNSLLLKNYLLLRIEMKKVEKLTKFEKFGLTVHPKGVKGVDWRQLTKEEIVNKLEELEYVRPSELARVLNETHIFKESKKNKSTEERIDYYFDALNFGGQLELGDKNGIPHYQC